ncbi:MAG: FAD-dependent oxidoreductase [Polyangia bacterium]|jgi:2,4-dienoyl-CoA reductase (NADPH2)|nr:FAD-dependent oxidoreductase [Polyangia bacterium]
MHPTLMSPIHIGKLELPNRILMPAMHLNLTPAGEVTPELIAFYVERAKGGAGLMIIGACTVCPSAGAPFMIRAQTDADLEHLAPLSRAIREAGGRAGLQIYHGGAYVHSFLIGGEPAVSASEHVSGLTGETARALTSEEVGALVGEFASAAERTKRAGFDCVEICGSAGYIISQFLSGRTNKRDDEWGGDEERRMRFGLEIVRATRARTGPDFPILFRLAGNPFVEDGGGSGLTARFASALEEAGVDAFNVTGGWHETRVPQLTGAVPSGGLSYLARVVREKVSVPVVACNRITTPSLAEKVLKSRHADLIGLGRALIADPEFPRKVAEGRSAEIVRCIACNQGCFDAVFNLVPCRCMTNPAVGKELELAAASPAKVQRKVVVVGAGPAGLAAAWTAAKRGHKVTVLERAASPGGQLRLAGARVDRHGFWELAEDLTGRAVLAGAEIRYGVEATPELIASLGAEVVVLATGARPTRPPIPGVELPHVLQSWDVLANKVDPGDRVVVVGGGATGCEVALHLAERGVIDPETVAFLLLSGAEEPLEIVRLATQGTREVTLVEMTKKVGKDIGRSTRWGVLQDLGRFGIRQLTATEVVRIEPGQVVLRSGEKEHTLGCDHVVLATGVASESALAAALEGKGLQVEVVGDARTPTKAITAVHDGFDLGASL